MKINQCRRLPYILCKLYPLVLFLLMKTAQSFQFSSFYIPNSNRWLTDTKLFQRGEILKSNMNKISIEYCIGCRWIHRAHWMSTELLTTFNDNSILKEVSIRPSSETGTFKIILNEDTVLFNRGEEKRFPELKEIKQKIRNIIDPSKNLGHSDSRDDVTTEESEWIEYIDEEGTPYYYNQMTGESSWYKNGIEIENED